MEFRPVDRADGSYQRTVTAERIEAMCARAFGESTKVLSAVELGDGTYNSTYRVELSDGEPVILRVAPEPARQFRSERAFMRHEHAALPYFAPVAALMPRTLAIDFTHEVVGRDYVFQTLLPGRSGPEGLAGYPRSRWGHFYRDLGTIARRMQAVRGPHFGPVAGPGFATWSEAFHDSLTLIALDLDDCGVDAADVRRTAAAAEEQRAVLDEITEPRLLHGDLWTVNTILAADAPVPTITGVFDSDRVTWGDPEADWCVYRAADRPGAERDAFWDTYGPLAAEPRAVRRRLFYTARHCAALMLEAHRGRRPDGVAAARDDLRAAVAGLGVPV